MHWYCLCGRVIFLYSIGHIYFNICRHFLYDWPVESVDNYTFVLVSVIFYLALAFGIFIICLYKNPESRFYKPAAVQQITQLYNVHVNIIIFIMVLTLD